MGTQLSDAGFELLLSAKDRERVWQTLAERLERYTHSVEGLSVPVEGSKEEIRGVLRDFPIGEPRDPVSVVHWIADQLTKYQLHTAHPAYFGVFNPNPSTMGIVGETLAAAFNPQLASTFSSRFCIEVENTLIQFFGKKFGYAENKIEGNFTTGATEANYTALLCALADKVPEFAEEGLRRAEKWPVVYATKETHHSILRAARLCGLGTQAVVELPVDRSLQFDLSALKARIALDKKEGRLPLFLVGTLGSTSAGEVDPLRALSQVAEEEGLWFHVDAAWGGAICLLDEYRSLLDGVEASHSISFDPHKWLSVPMGAGMFLTSQPSVLTRTFQVEASYYMPKETYVQDQVEPYRQSMQWSRRFIGLKLYLTLLVHGESGYQSVLRHQIEMGHRLRTLLTQRNWRVLNHSPLPVVCFENEGDPLDVEAIANEIAATGKSWITTTKLHSIDKKVLRVGISNFATQDTHLEMLVELLEKARRSQIHASPSR